MSFNRKSSAAAVSKPKQNYVIDPTLQPAAPVAGVQSPPPLDENRPLPPVVQPEAPAPETPTPEEPVAPPPPAAAPQAQLAAVPLEENVHDDSVMFRVRDTTAIHGARTHIMLDENGKQIPFRFLDNFGYINCPYRFALKFARIEEFEVLDESGRRIKAVPTVNRPAGIQLSDNEVIATLDELTTPALLKRANNAGGKFPPNVSRAKVMTFLSTMAGMQIIADDGNVVNQARVKPDSEDGEAGSAGDAELDSED